jgi:hypothetical protein
VALECIRSRGPPEERDVSLAYPLEMKVCHDPLFLDGTYPREAITIDDSQSPERVLSDVMVHASLAPTVS